MTTTTSSTLILDEAPVVRATMLAWSPQRRAPVEVVERDVTASSWSARPTQRHPHVASLLASWRDVEGAYHLFEGLDGLVLSRFLVGRTLSPGFRLKLALDVLRGAIFLQSVGQTPAWLTLTLDDVFVCADGRATILQPTAAQLLADAEPPLVSWAESMVLEPIVQVEVTALLRAVFRGVPALEGCLPTDGKDPTLFEYHERLLSCGVEPSLGVVSSQVQPLPFEVSHSTTEKLVVQRDFQPWARGFFVGVAVAGMAETLRVLFAT
jgi:hypothetical protein